MLMTSVKGCAGYFWDRGGGSKQPARYRRVTARRTGIQEDEWRCDNLPAPLAIGNQEDIPREHEKNLRHRRVFCVGGMNFSWQKTRLQVGGRTDGHRCAFPASCAGLFFLRTYR